MPLIRLISSLVLLAFAAACVLFALLNYEAVTIDVVVDRVPVPLFLLVLVPLALGVVIGWFLAWLKAGRHRREKRHERKRARDLEREVGAMKKQEEERAESPAPGPDSGRAPATAGGAAPGLTSPTDQRRLAAPAAGGR
jgi:uncharacterized integral membrane protein